MPHTLSNGGLGTATAEIHFLVRSGHRMCILRALSRTESASVEDLRRQCTTSASTLERNLDLLEEYGWIRRQNQDYTITSLGAIFIAELNVLLNMIEAE